MEFSIITENAEQYQMSIMIKRTLFLKLTAEIINQSSWWHRSIVELLQHTNDFTLTEACINVEN